MLKLLNRFKKWSLPTKISVIVIILTLLGTPTIREVINSHNISKEPFIISPETKEINCKGSISGQRAQIDIIPEDRDSIYETTFPIKITNRNKIPYFDVHFSIFAEFYESDNDADFIEAIDSSAPHECVFDDFYRYSCSISEIDPFTTITSYVRANSKECKTPYRLVFSINKYYTSPPKILYPKSSNSEIDRIIIREDGSEEVWYKEKSGNFTIKGPTMKIR